MKFRKKPIVIDAFQWFKNGDHPDDFPDGAFDPYCPREGAVVRYYRHPDYKGTSKCKNCYRLMHEHGWIDTLEGGHIVCPADWIIKGIKGEYYPCKPDIFRQTYEPVDDENG